MRITVKDLITKDLGYCCEHLFFSLYPGAVLIAARLGVSPSAVKKHRAACGGCAGAPNCMKDKLFRKKLLNSLNPPEA